MVQLPTQTPYATNQELWYFNGVALQDPFGAWNISTMGGSRFGLPTLRGQNIAAPYRAGQSFRSKYPDQRTITLTMWTDGQGSSAVDAAAYPASDQRLAFNNNLQSLRQLFWARNSGGSAQATLQRNWYLTQGGSNLLVQSTGMAEIAGSMDLTMNGRTNAAFSVDLLMADPYFYGALQTHACTGGSTSLTALGEGIVGEGWPSSVSAFTVSLSAAATVSNSTIGGVSFTVSTGPSFPVTVDILNNTVIDNLGNNVIGNFSHAGSRLWMCLQPGTNSIAVSAGTATFRWNDVYI
jgi:hypothetical protein